ncbi:MAG: alkaline phosphatase D family protein, partial [Thermoleophilaceae bacterium]|nr:alkaline phosphatase D family protein [Thermoleophilaceae bacterium]
VPVHWEVADDERFAKIVAHGRLLARPELAHTVHVEVQGLRPGREYFYRFRVGTEISPTGRTKTAAAPRAMHPLRFAFASCQHYEHGFYTAYRHMADEDLDIVFHLGDYIYEYGPGEYPSSSGLPRSYSRPETVTLEDYRDRYAVHRGDKDLQAAHQAFPWVVAWDDHEVKDNYAAATCAGVDPAAFARRRAAAYQAYYEHMPLRRASAPRAGGMRLHRRVDFGELVRFNVLDTRQYRGADSLLGMDQERWLLEGLRRPSARWNVLAQQLPFAPRDPALGDAWDGYPAARNRMGAALAEPAVSNPIVLSGDVHSNWANHILADYDNPDSEAIGTEFVGTSITSGGDGTDRTARATRGMTSNPHVKFFNGQRGYVRCRVTESDWRTDYRVVEYVTREGAEISTRASFVAQDGNPGLSLL